MKDLHSPFPRPRPHSRVCRQPGECRPLPRSSAAACRTRSCHVLARTGTPQRRITDSVCHSLRIGIIPPASPPASGRLLTGFLLGAGNGTVATIAVALASPGLYIDWGLLPGVLLVIPLATLGLTALVVLPLALLRRLAWGATVAALLTAVLVGELIFLGSQGTAFARWSASRHWAAVGRRAAAERAATQQETCRRVLAEALVPPPPTPGVAPGARVAPTGPRSDGSSHGSLVLLDRERCAELLGR
jgi:hypothetical protein